MNITLVLGNLTTKVKKDKGRLLLHCFVTFAPMNQEAVFIKNRSTASARLSTSAPRFTDTDKHLTGNSHFCFKLDGNYLPLLHS